MKRRGFAYVVAALVAATAVGVAAPCSAQTATADERAGARAAAMQGLKAMDEKRWADAVDLFKRAESLVHAPTVRLYLARSYVQLGQLVNAQEIYARLANEELPANASKPFVAAKADGTAELRELEPRIPMLTIRVVGSSAPSVTMDGVVVSSALIGIPRPVDPGEHTIKVTAQGFDTQSQTLKMREQGAETATFTLHASTGAAAVAPGAPSAAPAPPPPAPRDLTSEPPRDVSTGGSPALRTIGFISLGVAVVGVGAGAVFALVSHGDVSDSQALCPSGTCTPANAAQAASLHSQVTSLNNSATSAGQLAYTGFIVGGVAAATGVTLLIVGASHHSDSATATSAGVTPWVGLGSVGLDGRF